MANVSYPTPFDRQSSLFRDAELVWAAYNDVPTTGPAEEQAKDLMALFASAGYYRCFEQSRCATESVTQKNQMNQLLNNAPASFEGAILRFTRQGKYYYMCSRNNNFTNRSQKGELTVN